MTKEETLAHLRELGRLTSDMEHCLKSDRAAGKTWEECAQRVGLPPRLAARYGLLLDLRTLKTVKQPKQPKPERPMSPKARARLERAALRASDGVPQEWLRRGRAVQDVSPAHHDDRAGA